MKELEQSAWQGSQLCSKPISMNDHVRFTKVLRLSFLVGRTWLTYLTFSDITDVACAVFSKRDN